jgi:hypothetical protein
MHPQLFLPQGVAISAAPLEKALHLYHKTTASEYSKQYEHHQGPSNMQNNLHSQGIIAC